MLFYFILLQKGESLKLSEFMFARGPYSLNRHADAKLKVAIVEFYQILEIIFHWSSVAKTSQCLIVFIAFFVFVTFICSSHSKSNGSLYHLVYD